MARLEARRLRLGIAVDVGGKRALGQRRIGILVGVEPDRVGGEARIRVRRNVERRQRQDLRPGQAFGERGHAAASSASRASAARACASRPSSRASSAAGRARRARRLGRDRLHADRLEEAVDRDAAPGAGGAVGGEDVARPGEIVAERLGRLAAGEDGAGIADLAEQRRPDRRPRATDARARRDWRSRPPRRACRRAGCGHFRATPRPGRVGAGRQSSPPAASRRGRPAPATS